MKHLKLLAIATLLTTHCFAQWTQLPSLFTGKYEKIYCTSKDTCYAVGLDYAGGTGIIMETTDGGMNWTKLSTGTTAWLTGVYFTNSKTGFIIGGEILKTIDGGVSWQSKQSFAGSKSISFYGDSLGFVGGDGGGQLMKTFDAGETWNWSNLYKVAKGWVNSIFFTNANNGYVAESTGTTGSIFKTIDGGDTWKNFFTNPKELTSVFFANDSIGYTVGYDGVIFKTQDAGITWDTLASGTTDGLNSIFCLNKDTCYAVGYNGTILKTTNGGKLWEKQNVTPSSVNWAFNSVFFRGTSGYAVGTGGAVKTDFGTGIINASRGRDVLSFYPNPIGIEKTINIKINTIKQYDGLFFTIYDLLGKRILQTPIHSDNTRLNLVELNNGLYIYVLTDNNAALATGKLMLQQ